jgi:putative transcriptional regulator
MTPRYHPSDATLLTYAAGALGEGLALVVASHLAYCDECNAAVASGEVIGGSLLDALAPESLDVGAHERVLALLGAAPDRPPPPPRAIVATVPAPLARYLDRDFATLPWRRLGPGLRQFEVLAHDPGSGANLRLLRIAPGRRLPRHGHNGTELTLVLAGSYTDELGQFGRGDVCETDTDIVHEPVCDRDEECICLIATEGRLKFESPIARLFQRFSGV